MGGWLCTARPEACGECGRSATLLARTRRCDLCEADAYDAAMLREFPQWFVPYRPRLPELTAVRVEAAACS
jgi:hypothetical protein